MNWQIAIITFLLFFVSPVYAKSGCCSQHGGIDHCDNSVGKYVCKDGSYSPSCECEYTPQNQVINSTNTPDVQKSTITPLPSVTSVPTVQSSPTFAPTSTPEITIKQIQNIISPTIRVAAQETTPGNPVSGLIGVGVVGGGIYWVYKKIKSRLTSKPS